MLTVRNIEFISNGTKIKYDYVVSSSFQKYFNSENLFYVKYSENVSNTPLSIAIIPLLANILPISWFAGFDIYVDEVDKDFYDAISDIKKVFIKNYPDYKLDGNFKPKKLVENKIESGKSAMLFSGGVDAFATYIRLYNQTPDLVTIHGADITIEDTQQWEDLKEFNEAEPLLGVNNKKYIETNLRDFYTFKVELLLKDLGWWGKIQHGLALVGVLAPLSFKNRYTNIHIASSYTDHIDIAWGSVPEIDEKISWAGIKVHHDGYKLKRQDKVDLITDFCRENKKQLRLRVCYSELRDEFNCSNCEKCFRTILGIVLTGQDPNKYGFNVNESFYSKMYERLEAGSASKGMKYFWWELMEKAKNVNDFYVFNNIDVETRYIDEVRNGKIDLMLEKKVTNPKKTGKIKFILRNKFPWLQNFYRKIRYNK